MVIIATRKVLRHRCSECFKTKMFFTFVNYVKKFVVRYLSDTVIITSFIIVKGVKMPFEIKQIKL